MSSREPSVVTLARRAMTTEIALSPGSVVLVAVSGGPDSMALLDVLARLAPKLGLGVFAHGIDHGLRPDAAAELDRAEELAARLDVPFGRSRVDLDLGGNLQARARKVRYEALARAARAVRASAIATAHHADDRAETVLLRLMRGAGPRGLAVLPARAPLASSFGEETLDLVRPLVRVRRTAILAHLERHAIPFSSDPSNLDPRFQRVRVRRELMPLLERLSPQIVAHLNALADQLAEERPASYGEASGLSLPRSTQRALADLARSRSTSARVWLPNGLVVSVDPSPPTPPGPTRRPPRGRTPPYLPGARRPGEHEPET